MAKPPKSAYNLISGQISSGIDVETRTASSGESLSGSMGLATAGDVAGYLIHIASIEEEPQYLTHLQLQKLLYYVQGWSLALRDRPMFDERIEAWAHGPVVKAVYPLFSHFGSKPIPPEEVEFPRYLSEKDRQFITSVWNAYRAYSAWSLREMAHKESPWIVARGNTPPAEVCNREITQESMKEFFSKQSR